MRLDDVGGPEPHQEQPPPANPGTDQTKVYIAKSKTIGHDMVVSSTFPTVATIKNTMLDIFALHHLSGSRPSLRSCSTLKPQKWPIMLAWLPEQVLARSSIDFCDMQHKTLQAAASHAGRADSMDCRKYGRDSHHPNQEHALAWINANDIVESRDTHPMQCCDVTHWKSVLLEIQECRMPMCLLITALSQSIKCCPAARQHSCHLWSRENWPEGTGQIDIMPHTQRCIIARWEFVHPVPPKESTHMYTQEASGANGDKDPADGPGSSGVSPATKRQCLTEERHMAARTSSRNLDDILRVASDAKVMLWKHERACQMQMQPRHDSRLFKGSLQHSNLHTAHFSSILVNQELMHTLQLVSLTNVSLSCISENWSGSPWCYYEDWVAQAALIPKTHPWQLSIVFMALCWPCLDTSYRRLQLSSHARSRWMAKSKCAPTRQGDHMRTCTINDEVHHRCQEKPLEPRAVQTTGSTHCLMVKMGMTRSC